MKFHIVSPKQLPLLTPPVTHVVDWNENLSGERSQARISVAYGSDLNDCARDVLVPCVQSIFDEFSSRYSWGKPSQVEALFGQEQNEEVTGPTAQFSTGHIGERNAYDELRSRLIDGRGFSDDGLLEFLAGQDRYTSPRWGYVANRRGSPGLATVYWRGTVASAEGFNIGCSQSKNEV